MHFNSLKILLTIPICNMIPCLLNFVFFSRFSLFSLSEAHYWGNLALKSPVVAEHAGLRSLIFDKSELRSVQKSSNSLDVWVGDLYKHVKKHFLFSNFQLSDSKFTQLAQTMSF